MAKQQKDGWVKLWRQSLNSRVWQNPHLWQLWCYCLLHANHEGKWVSVSTGRGETEVYVEPGQFIFGRFEAAKALRAKPISTYKRLLKLKTMQNVNTQNKTHYTLVSICNWHFYQNGQVEGNTQVTPKEHPSNTNKNDKNDKKQCKALSADLLLTFNRFWEVYPKKVAKQEASKAWQKLKPSKQLTKTIIVAVERFEQTSQWQRENRRYAPNPATFLNKRRWEDEIIEETPAAEPLYRLPDGRTPLQAAEQESNCGVG